jgi:hypothetical protein
MQLLGFRSLCTIPFACTSFIALPNVVTATIFFQSPIVVVSHAALSPSLFLSQPQYATHIHTDNTHTHSLCLSLSLNHSTQHTYIQTTFSLSLSLSTTARNTHTYRQHTHTIHTPRFTKPQLILSLSHTHPLSVSSTHAHTHTLQYCALREWHGPDKERGKSSLVSAVQQGSRANAVRVDFLQNLNLRHACRLHRLKVGL